MVYNNNYPFKHFSQFNVAAKDLSPSEFAWICQEEGRIQRRRNRQQESSKKDEILDIVAQMKQPKSADVERLMDQFRIRHLDKAIVSNKQMTLLDIVMSAETPNFAMIKLLLEMGASPENRYLDLRFHVLSVALKSGNSSIISFLASHGFGSKDQYPTSSDKVLWEVSQAFNKNNRRGDICTGWEDGYSSNDVVSFFLLRSDIYEGQSGQLYRYDTPSVPYGYLDCLKQHLDQCSDPALLRKGLEIYAKLTNRQDVQSLFDDIVKAQLENSQSDYRKKVFSWYVSHEETISPMMREIISKALKEEVHCEKVLLRRDFVVLKDLLTLYRKWPNREVTYGSLVRDLFENQLKGIIHSAGKSSSDAIGLKDLERLSEDYPLSEEMLETFMGRALELDSPVLVELLIKCSSQDTLKSASLISSRCYKLNSALCSLFKTVGTLYPKDQVLQRALLKRFYDGPFYLNEKESETFLNTLLDSKFDMTAVGSGGANVFKYALRTSNPEIMIEKILENPQSKLLLKQLDTIVSDLLYHKLPRMALICLNEGAPPPKSDAVKYHRRSDDHFTYLALIKKLIDLGTSREELVCFTEIFFFDERNRQSDGIIDSFLKVNTRLQDLQLDELMTTKNLAHVVGDVFVQDQFDDEGNSLEGNTFQQSIALFVKLLEVSNTDVRDAVSAFNSMYTVSQYLVSLKFFNSDHVKLKQGLNGVAEWISGQIEACPDEQPFLIPLQFSQHATLVEVVRRSSGKYSFKLYNTGYGLNYHDQVVGDNKDKFLPFIEFSDIPAKELCSPLFIKSLIEPGILPERVDGDIKVTFSAADIYEGVLKRFVKYRVPTKITDDVSFITAQRSGTCSFRCLQAYLRDRLGKSRYKKVMFDMKRDALHLVLNSAPYEELKTKDKRRRLIIDAVTKLARKSKKRLIQGNLSHDELQESILFIQSAKDKLKDISKSPSSTHGQFNPNLEEVLGTERQKSVMQEVIQKWHTILRPKAQVDSTYSPRYSPQLFIDFNDDDSTGAKLIEKLRSLSQLKGMKDSREVFEIFHEGIIRLPLPPSRVEEVSLENPWCQLSHEERSQCLKILSDLSFEYLDFVKKAKNTSKVMTDQHIAIHKLLACSYGIALMNDHAVSGSTSKPSFISGAILNNLPLETLRKHRVLHSYDPKVERQLDDLCDFFADADLGKGSGCLFSITSPFFSKGINSRQDLDSFRNSPQYRFLKSYPLSSDQIKDIEAEKKHYGKHFRLNSHFLFDDFKVFYLWKRRINLTHLDDYFHTFDIFYNCIKLANGDSSSRKLDVDFVIVSDHRMKTEESCITSSLSARSISHFNEFLLRQCRENLRYEVMLLTPGVQNPTILSRPEKEQILHGLAFSPHLAISRLISLYSGQNLYQLIDSNEQEFFTHLLFYHKALNRSLVVSPGNSEILLKYLSTSLTELKVQMASYNSAATNFIRNGVKDAEEAFAEQSRLGMAYLFLLQMQNSVFEYCMNANISINNHLMRKNRDECIRWRDGRSGLAIADDPVIRRQAALITLLTYNGRNEDDLVAEEIGEIAFTLRLQETLSRGDTPYSPVIHVDDPVLLNKALSYSSKIHHRINKILNNEEALKLFVEKTFRGVELPSEIHWEMVYPVLQGKSPDGTWIEFHWNDGLLTKNGKPVVSSERLPKKYEYLYQLFGSDKGLFTTYLTDDGSNVVYEGKTEKGDQISVQFSRPYFVYASAKLKNVQRHFNGKNYVLISRETIDKEVKWPELFPYEERENVSLWLSTTFPADIICLDNETQEVIATINDRGEIVFPQQDPNKYFYSINCEIAADDLKCFSQLSDPRDVLILEARNPCKDRHVEVRLFKCCHHTKGPLSFVKREVKTVISSSSTYKFVWQENPDYFLAEDQTLAGLNDLERFLVLENSCGEKKVIIPYWRRSDTGIKDFYRYEVIDLDHDNKPKARSVGQSFLLAYHALAGCDYERAMDYLKRAPSFKEFTDEELMLLGWIALYDKEEKGKHPESLAVRSYASWLAHRNKPQSISETEKTGAKEVFSDPYDLKGWRGFWNLGGIYKNGETTAKAVDVMNRTYSEYLRVCTNVRKTMRLEASTSSKLTGILPDSSLISPYEEATWLLSLRASSLSNRLLIRLSQLLHLQMPKLKGTYSADVEVPQDLSGEAVKWCINTAPFYDDSNDTLHLNELFPLTRLQYDKYFWGLLELTKGPKKKIVHDIIMATRYQDLNHEQMMMRLILDHCSSDDGDAEKVRDYIYLIRKGTIKQDALSELGTLLQRYSKTHLTGKVRTLSGVDSVFQADPYDTLIPRLGSSKTLPSLVPSSGSPNGANILAARYFMKIDKGSHREYTFPNYEHITNTELSSHIKEIEVDYQIGCSLNDQSCSYKLKEEGSFEEKKIMVRKVRDEILHSHRSQKNAMKSIKKKILKIANSIPEDSDHFDTLRLAKLGGEMQTPSFEYCLRLFTQGDKHYVSKKLLIPIEQVDHLFEKIERYLLIAVDNQQLARADKDLSRALEARTNEKFEGFLERAAATLYQKRAYQPHEHPQILVFEYYSGMILYQHQYEALVQLLRNDQETFTNTFVQRIMGGGKTVVLSTLMALLKADGYHLSLLVLPASLYDTQAVDMSKRSDEIFGQRAQTIRFSRDDAYFTKEYLLQLKYTIHRAIVDRDFLIMPPEVLQCLYDKSIEVLDQTLTNTDKELWEKSELLQEILATIKERSIMTIDEVDTLMDPKHEFNFPIGAGNPLQPKLLSLVKELFCIAATDPSIKQAGLHLLKNEQAYVDENNYSIISDILSQKMVLRLKSEEDYCKLLKIPHDADEKWCELTNFLSGKSGIPHFVRDLGQSVRAEDQQAAEAIILLHIEINELLPKSWKQTANLNYGRSHLNKQRKIVIPYLAAKTPEEASEYSNRWDMVNKTYQWYLSQGLDLDQMKILIEELRNDAINEYQQHGGSKPFKETKSAQKFRRLIAPLDLKLLDVTPSNKKQMALISERLRSPSAEAISVIMDFVSVNAFKGETFYEEQIASNAHTFTSLAHAVNGYSGTMDSRHTFSPPSTSGLSKADSWEVVLDKGTNGRIIDHILKKNPSVHVIDDMPPRELLKSLLESHTKKQEFHAFIDTGALFKNSLNKKIAIDILSFFEGTSSSHIAGVLYYDNMTNMLMCLKKEGELIELPPVTDSKTIASVTGLKMEQLFVFFDHRHTRGANILLPDHARAFTTVGIDTELDLFLQGAMRMRGLAKSQSVEAVIPKGLIGKINKVIGKKQCGFTFQELLLYTMLNKFSLRKEKYFTAYLQMIEAEIRNFILFHSLNVVDSEKKKEIFRKTRSLFIRDVAEKLFLDFIADRGRVKVVDFFEMYIKNLMDIAAEATNNQDDLLALNQKLNLYKDYGLKNQLFPSEVTGIGNRALHPPGSTVQQVRQQQVQQQVQQQQQIRQRRVVSPNPHEECKWDLQALNEKTVERVLPDFVSPMKNLQTNEIWKKWNTLLNERLLASMNFLMTEKNRISLYDDPAKKPIHEILILRDNVDAPWIAVLLSAEEAKTLQQAMNSDGQAISIPMAILSTSGLVVAKTKEADINPLRDPQIRGFLLISHILNGNIKVLIQKEWKDLFAEWLGDKPDQKVQMVEACLTDSYQRNIFNAQKF